MLDRRIFENYIVIELGMTKGRIVVNHYQPSGYDKGFSSLYPKSTLAWSEKSLTLYVKGQLHGF